VSERHDRRLLRESAAARPHLAVAGAIGVVAAVATVAQAALLAHIIAGAAFRHETLSRLTGSIVALLGVFVARALLSGGFELSGRLAAFRVLSELRNRLVRRLLIERPGLRPDERTGELAAVAVQGVDALESYFAGYLPSFVMALVVPAAILIWVAPLDLAAAVILAVTIPVLVGFMVLIGVGADSATRRRWQSLSLLSSHFLDVVRGLETLRAYRREGAQAEILAGVGDRYRRETMGTLRVAFLSALVLELCAMLGIALVAATIGVQLTAGNLTFEAGLTVLLLAPELYDPLRQVGQQFHAAADGLAAVGGILNVLDRPPAIADPDAPATAPDPRLEPVRIACVSFGYPGRPPVLSDLDLNLEPCEFVALIGPSGAGKSTVAALLLRLLDPSSGRVRCGEIDLRDLRAEDWRRRTAWVPQRTQLFTATLAENIALAVPDAAPARIEQAARQAGLGELLGSLPAGLDTRVGDGGRRLSGGEAQRVALARAFLSDASLVVLDEPTANLDADTAAAVGEAIVELAHGRSMLLITHDRRLAERADRTVELGRSASHATLTAPGGTTSGGTGSTGGTGVVVTV